MDGPRISIVNGGKIIALQEEGYYLKAELTSKAWKFQIDDFRYPKGPLCTHTITIDTPQKLIASPYATDIRKAYRAIFYDNASSYLSQTINLIQLYAKDFETDEPEPDYKPKGNESKADRLVNLALEQGLTLFRDQFGVQYARIPMKKWSCEASEADSLLITPIPTGHTVCSVGGGGYLEENSSTSSTASLIHQTWPIDSEIFKQWLSGIMWSTDNEAVKADHLNSAIMVLNAMANEKPKTELYNRVAPDGLSGFYIDLTNDNWEAIHVTSEIWEIVQQPTLFKRYAHQIPLGYPSKTPDISKLFKYINIGCLGDEERHVNEQLLYLIGLITAYIPGFPHVGNIIHGGAGKVKSSTQKLCRKLIDPSSMEYNRLNKKDVSRIQQLEQHYYQVFDNLRDLDDETSDDFSRAITGAAFQTRKLFTNDEAFLRAFKRVVNMNGINIPGESPDLLDRMIVFEALYIPMSKRRGETELNKEFELDAPDILAAILDILVKAIKIYPTIHLERLPRMADFALWGCAVSEALGIPHTKFINAYYQNMLNVKGDVVKSRITGQLVIDFLDLMLGDSIVNGKSEPRKKTSFSILTSNLHYQIMGIAKQFNMDTRNLPADPTRLSRELNIIAENLPSLGYVMTKKSTNKGIELIFSKLKETTLDSNLEGSPKSYHNVWKVSDLSQLLKPGNSNSMVTLPLSAQAAQVKTIETVFGFIFDHGTVQDRYISQELKIELPELSKLLAVLVKDELIDLILPDKYRVKEAGSE